MANEWIYNNATAKYNTTTPGFTLVQKNKMTIGRLYHISFDILDSTQGKITVNSFEGNPTFSGNGSHEFTGIAKSKNIIFNPGVLGGVFNGAIDNVIVTFIPFYQIRDVDDVAVFTLEDTTGVSASGEIIQYVINWEDIDEGCYHIYVSDGTTEYNSDCLSVKLTHDCTLLLQWTNNETAFGMNYSDLDFEQSLRLRAKLDRPTYESDKKEVFVYSNGDRRILYTRKKVVESLRIYEVPRYIHDALAVGLDHDTFLVEGVRYVFEDTSYDPVWRKSSNLAPVEVDLVKDGQNLVNSNCG